MVEIGNVKEVIKDYIIKQLVSMGESSPAIRLLSSDSSLFYLSKF